MRLVIDLLWLPVILRHAVNHRLRLLDRLLLVDWCPQNLILSNWGSGERLGNRGNKLWLNQSLSDWFIGLLHHLEVMLVFVIFLGLLHVHSMLILEFVLMLNDCLLSLQVVFMFLLHFPLMFFLSLSCQFLLLFEVSRLIGLFIMFNMFRVLLVLLFQVSVDLFLEEGHVLLDSLLYLLVDQVGNSIPQVVRDLIQFVLVWALLVIGLLFQLVQFFLWCNRYWLWNYLWDLWYWNVDLWWWSHDDWLLNVLLLLFKFSQLSFSLFNILFRIIDVVILSVQIIQKSLVVNYML